MGLSRNTRDRAPAAGPFVLTITAFDLGHCVYQALKAGVSGFLLEEEPTGLAAAG